MSYDIDKENVKRFVENEKTYKLPRYQRRQVWKSDRNFKLAISVFQGYPIGTIIIHKRGVNKSLLLDGRQRRAALVEMMTNPTALYSWAKDFIKFSGRSSERKLSKDFWGKISLFLQEEDSDVGGDGDGSYSDSEVVEEGIGEEGVTDKTQRNRLRVLLDLILMVHEAVQDEEKWEDIFDFSGSGVGIEKYWDSRTKVNPVKLRSFLIGYAENFPDLKKEEFIEYCKTEAHLKGENPQFEEEINAKWGIIRRSIDAILRAEDIYSEAWFVMITLKEDVSYFDALNIFSRVNSDGMQLSQEELLSAKPYWNKKVDLNIDECANKGKRTELEDTDKRIRDLHKRFETQEGSNMEIVRWDIAATLIPRLEDELVLKQSREDEDKGKFFGFRLLSSLYKGGVSKRHLSLIETDEGIFREGDMYGLVFDLKKVLEIVRKSRFFDRYSQGKRSLMEILGVAPAFEFITILFLSWKEKGEPSMLENGKKSPKIQELQREAFILFDKLTYEKASGMWRGTSDSTMAKNIVKWKERVGIEGNLGLRSIEDWKRCISLSADPSSMKWPEKVAVLYYVEALRNGFVNSPNTDDTYEVDHIIPQSEFRKSTNKKDKDKKDNLGNLALLPKYWNDTKGNMSLIDLNSAPEDECGTRIEEVVEGAIGIKKEEFKNYSGIKHIDDLIKDRTDRVLLEAFKIRDKILENPELK